MLHRVAQCLIVAATPSEIPAFDTNASQIVWTIRKRASLERHLL
jgi:hypothetical protein